MNAIRTRLTIAAGLVIIALTAAAFWLSYAHLHDVASSSGLGGSPERAWAWPATLDLFIVAGEIMMLVAALNKTQDGWAIGLTVTGSVGSIGLNVFGVGANAPGIQYVVAAVPPTAALLAFGALMRQVHAAITEPAVETVQEAVQEAAAEPVEALPEPAVNEPAEEPQEVTEEPQQRAPRATSRPTPEDVDTAVKDIQREGGSLTGKALADYFGVSDRSGRRYLNMWMEQLVS